MARNLATSSTYVVSYDIADPSRLRRVFKTMKGWGLHIQYSVFQCDLTPKALTDLQSELEDLIDHHADQVLFICVGPSNGRGKNAIKAMGKPYAYLVREALVF